MFPVFFHEKLVKLDSQWQFWILLIKRISKHLKPKLSQPKHHQIWHVGNYSESSWWAQSKTVIGSPIWPSFHREIWETSGCKIGKLLDRSHHLIHNRRVVVVPPSLQGLKLDHGSSYGPLIFSKYVNSVFWLNTAVHWGQFTLWLW